MDKQNILIIDDDKNILTILELYLQKEGFNVSTCETGTGGLEAFHNAKPALVVLDVMLPGKDGFAVLDEIRSESATPVIMLTAKGATPDRVQGLNGGADDYMAKPFDSKELIARINAVLRRAAGNADSGQKVTSYTIKGLEISMENYTVTVDGQKVDMTPKEIELLFFLATHPKVYTRDELLKEVWDFDVSVDTRTVDVHVKRIREKIGERYAVAVHTVWGVGYKFDETLVN